MDIDFVFIFILGSIFASFANVCIRRIPRHISVIKGRSYCFSCKKQLKWYETIPIISYIGLKGKCLNCKCHIPIRDWYIEIVGGIISCLCFHLFYFSWEGVIFYSIIMLFIIISFVDIDSMIIPNELLVILGICVGIWNGIRGCYVYEYIIGIFLVSVPMYVLNLIKECFGGGDIKLFAVIGFFLGSKKVIVCIFSAIFLCSIYCIFLILGKRTKKEMKIPFGPFICLSTIITFFYGNKIIEWYLSLLMGL